MTARAGKSTSADGGAVHDAMPRANTQDFLLNILGGYVALNSGEFWSGGLVSLLQDLGCSAQSARTALSRLVAAGLIARRASGRMTHYRLTDSGRVLLEDGHRRIFSFGRQDAWDGTWTVVSFSVPEAERAMRHRLRKRLEFLGFTHLHQAMWLAPRDKSSEAAHVLEALDIEQRAHLFLARSMDVQRLATVIRERWNVAALDGRYGEFLKCFGHLCDAHALDVLSDGEAFVLRTELIQAFREFMLRDPDLPDELVPELHKRGEAVEVFTTLWTALEPLAERYVHQHAEPPLPNVDRVNRVAAS